MPPAETIRLIDKRSDGICRELYRRTGRFNIFSAHDWQLAWDRHPNLYARREMLSRLRGLAQLDRDAGIERAHRADRRRLRNAFREGADRRQPSVLA